MKKSVSTPLITACLALAFGLATPALHARDTQSINVQFAAGASSKKISGSLKGKNDVSYKLRAGVGQTLKVSLKGQRTTVYFNVNPPGGDTALFVGSSEGEVFEGKLPTDGVYEIVVYQMGAAASGNKLSKFDMNIAVTNAKP